MTRQCKPLLWTAALALLTGCATPPLPPPGPRPLAADIHRAEQHAYWLGYGAGRRYQKQQDAQNTPDAPSPPPAPAAVPPDATPPVPPPAAQPLQPVPPPVDSYSANGPARPVATPVN